MCVITVKLPGWPEQDYISIVERLSSLKESKPREGQLYPLCQESLPILYSSTSWFGLPTFKGQQHHPFKFVFALQMHVQKNLWKCNYRQTECVCKPYYIGTNLHRMHVCFKKQKLCCNFPIYSKDLLTIIHQAREAIRMYIHEERVPHSH